MWRRWRSAAPLPIGVGVAYLGYLQYNRVQDRRAFVQLFLDQGEQLRTFLTNPRLKQMYNEYMGDEQSTTTTRTTLPDYYKRMLKASW